MLSGTYIYVCIYDMKVPWELWVQAQDGGEEGGERRESYKER